MAFPSQSFTSFWLAPHHGTSRNAAMSRGAQVCCHLDFTYTYRPSILIYFTVLFERTERLLMWYAGLRGAGRVD